MKIVKLLVTYVVLVGIVMSCQPNKKVENANFDNSIRVHIAKDVSPLEFQKLIEDNAIILDVRTADEYDAGHLEGAVNIDFYSKIFIDEVLKLDESKTLLIHCASGGRSSKAMSNLSDKGFNTMYNMLGGFRAWRQSNLPFVK